jgi:hypothetical protein
MWNAHRNIIAVFVLAIEALLGGRKVSVAAQLGAADMASVDIHRGVVRKERHGGWVGRQAVSRWR